MNLRFTEVDRKFDLQRCDFDARLSDMKIDLREVRSRVDYIADSLSLGRGKLREIG
jgi:hypothetical protein